MNKELELRLNETFGRVCPKCNSYAIMPTNIWNKHQCQMCGKTGEVKDFPKAKG